MKRLGLTMLVVLGLAGVVWAGVPNPVPPNLTGGGGTPGYWKGTILNPAGAIVPVKITVTSQNFDSLTGSLTLGTRTIEATGYIDGYYISMYGTDGAGHYIRIYGYLRWLPHPRILANYIYNEIDWQFGDSILTPSATP